MRIVELDSDGLTMTDEYGNMYSIIVSDGNCQYALERSSGGTYLANTTDIWTAPAGSTFSVNTSNEFVSDGQKWRQE